MVTHVFNSAKQRLLNGTIDLDNDDIRVSWHMTNTSIISENDGISTNSNFTTPGEFDGSGYSSPGYALGSLAVNLDDPNGRAEFDAADINAGAISAGTFNIAGFLVYKFITNWGLSQPIVWLEKTVIPDDNSITIQWSSEGIMHAT